MIKDARKIGTQAQEEKRCIAVQSVLKGSSHQQAADLVGVTRQSVTTWVKLYRDGGWKALKITNRGRPKGKRIKPFQAANICNTIKDKCPDQLKLFGYLWTAESVGALIERRFKIKYSIRNVQRLLKQWGYTPQKPIRRAYEQDPKAVKAWLKKDYPKIKSLAKRENALIYWEDETGARSDYHAGRSYGERGKTPILQDTGKRFGCNVVSAVTNRGDLSFMVFTGRFNAGMFIQFLKRLVKHVDRKVILIADGHPAHKAKKVKRWVAANSENIRLFYLPPYSPELNPDEYLNNDIKQNAVGRKRARTQKEMVSNIRGHLRSRQKKPNVVRGYFRHKDVRYAS